MRPPSPGQRIRGRSRAGGASPPGAPYRTWCRCRRRRALCLRARSWDAGRQWSPSPRMVSGRHRARCRVLRRGSFRTRRCWAQAAPHPLTPLCPSSFRPPPRAPQPCGCAHLLSGATAPRLMVARRLGGSTTHPPRSALATLGSTAGGARVQSVALRTRRRPTLPGVGKGKASEREASESCRGRGLGGWGAGRASAAAA